MSNPPEDTYVFFGGFGGGNGTTTAALASGTPKTTESLDGTTWTEVTESPTNHSSGAASGIYTDCIVFGGDNGPVTANTEEWAVPSKATKVLTD